MISNLINLGLPSGLLWSDRNLGAEDIYSGGLLFQWGDVRGYKPEEGQQKNFVMKDYKWYDNEHSWFTKYDQTDKKFILSPEDDSIIVNSDSSLRMPTQIDCDELLFNTSKELYAEIGGKVIKVAEGGEYQDGCIAWNYLDGYTSDEVLGKLTHSKLISKINGNFLIIPSSVMFVDDDRYEKIGFGGGFWSSSLLGYQEYALGIFFDSDLLGIFESLRCFGVGVRGVKE